MVAVECIFSGGRDIISLHHAPARDYLYSYAGETASQACPLCHLQSTGRVVLHIIQENC